MRRITEVLHLTHGGHLNTRQVALSLNISRSTVKDYQARARKAGLGWPLPETLSEEALLERLNYRPLRKLKQSRRGFTHDGCPPTALDVALPVNNQR